MSIGIDPNGHFLDLTLNFKIYNAVFLTCEPGPHGQVDGQFGGTSPSVGPSCEDKKRDVALFCKYMYRMTVNEQATLSDFPSEKQAVVKQVCYYMSIDLDEPCSQHLVQL